MPPPKSPPIPTTAANKPPTVNEAEVIRPNSIEAKMADSSMPPTILPMAANGYLRVMCQVIDSECITRSPSHSAGPTMDEATYSASISAAIASTATGTTTTSSKGPSTGILQMKNTTARARNRASAASIISSPAPSSLGRHSSPAMK